MDDATLFPNTPPLAEAMEAVYAAFDGAYPRPTAFYNEVCCVTREEEQWLIETPLRELDDMMVGHAISHYGACFGTFEQTSYFVPRALEFFAISPNGPKHGTLVYALFRLIREHEGDYRTAGVWGALEATIHAVFLDRISSSSVEHARDWVYVDSMVGAVVRDDLLEEYFGPKLRAEPVSADSLGALGYRMLQDAECTAWDLFFARWTREDDPCRVVHLLAVLWHQTSGQSSPEAVPESLWRELSRPVLSEWLLLKAAPVLKSAEAKAWERLLRGKLRRLEGEGPGR
jgi:hypothetical protein